MNFSSENSIDISLNSKCSNGDANAITDNFVEVEQDLNMKSDMPKLMKLIQDIYEKRLKDIENNENLNENEKIKEKMLSLQSYVNELQNQNDTFAATMIELEKEAFQRVKQMEKRLNSSARTTMETVINIHKCEEEMRKLIEERLYIESLFKDTQRHLSSIKVENGFLRDQNCNLNHDVHSLLRVIHQARSTGHWEIDCVTFCEVTPEQVFGPVQSLSNNCYGAEYDSDLSRNEKIDYDHSHHIHYNRRDYHPCIYCNGNKSECDSNLLCDCDKEISFIDTSSVKAASTVTSTPSHYSRVLTKKKTKFSFAQPFVASLPKCASLPDIGNVYSYTQAMHKSNSYNAIGNNRLLRMKSTKTYYKDARKKEDTPELLKNISLVENAEEAFCCHRGQSEPHLFMFNDNIYKYRPCESIENTSNAALIDNYELSLPTYQSIDLKFPTEESALKINAWNKLKTGSYPDAQENSFAKDYTLYSSCSCSESETRGLSKHMLKLFGEQLVSSTSTGRKISNTSIGLQTEVEKTTQATQAILENDSILEPDSSRKDMLQILKENLLKAKNQTEEKRVLCEQLQNHLTSALKQVELKDKALENLEKKLQNSRNECSTLKNQISTLNSEVDHIVTDLKDVCSKRDNLKLQNDQQGIIIRNLQEALVQSKRAFDAVHLNLPSESLQSGGSQQTLRSSIIDI